MDELDELNPIAESIVKETMFEEIGFLYRDMLDRNENYFSFYKPEGCTDELYNEWLSEKTHKALIFAVEHLLS